MNWARQTTTISARFEVKVLGLIASLLIMSIIVQHFSSR